ncbi:co-chaperone HscB [Parasalinivibrio latis]|uniref:co-chaperone HscB n=1 Tax=Parasalinivibrio latis TaxID=2952610 RepID=UPI0030E1EAC3
MNHFELFGLPFQFELDGSSLSSTYRELQRKFHPDNFATAGEREKLEAVQRAAQINDAFQTLKDPVRRAEYMLAENQVDIRAEQQTMQDPEFLMQQMMLREELEEISDSTDAEDMLFDFDGRIQVMFKSLVSELKASLDGQAWDDAAVIVRKLKFVVKLKDEIARVEDSLLG